LPNVDNEVLIFLA